jgi:DNA polymerase-3 subunit gamma/tau
MTSNSSPDYPAHLKSSTMTTTVLARKYRPRNFAQMAGQAHVVQALTNAITQRRLHHAYLFTGTRGIGKTTISRILARCLNCTGADGRGDITSAPCGVCSACTAIDADRYIDYIELDAASNRGIDDARDLIERAAYKPSVGRYKVFMIDEAHQLTKDAFNALLKTLEEPPEHLKFVLATTDPEKMLPTVLSRCLQFNLRPMAPETVHAHLSQVLQGEGVAADDGALRLLARAARGSMRDALSLTDQAIAYGGGRLEEAAVRAMLGVGDDALPVDLVRALVARDAHALLAGCDRVREAGVPAGSVLEQIVLLMQRTAVEQAVPGAAPADDPLTPFARELAPRLAADEAQLLYSLALHGREELALQSDEVAALTMVLLRFLAFASAPAATTTAPERAPAPATARPLRATPSVASLATMPRAAGADPALAERWDSTVRRLTQQGGLSGLARELAWQSQLVAESIGPPRQWTIAVEHDALRADALREKLAGALAAMEGQPLQLAVVIGQAADSPARREAAAKAAALQQAEQSLLADPAVQGLLNQFKTARIVPGSIRPLP